MSTEQTLEPLQALRFARIRCLARAAEWEREANRSEKATWERCIDVGRKREAQEIADWISALIAHLDQGDE